jgi:phage-related protein
VSLPRSARKAPQSSKPESRKRSRCLLCLKRNTLHCVRQRAAGTYRAIYTVRFADAVFVLHCFQKKSISGIATPKREIDVIRARLKAAELLAKELRRGKTSN